MLENFESSDQFKSCGWGQITEIVVDGEEIRAEFVLSEEVVALIAHESDEQPVSAGEVEKSCFTFEVPVDDVFSLGCEIEISANQAYIQ